MRGTVWIAWDDDLGVAEGGYRTSWQADRDEPGGEIEDGGTFPSLEEALTWARLRTDSIVVRPEWDSGTSYWAGTRSPGTRGLPPLSTSPNS